MGHLFAHAVFMNVRGGKMNMNKNCNKRVRKDMVGMKRLRTICCGGTVSLVMLGGLFLFSGCHGIVTNVHCYDGPKLAKENISKVVVEEKEPESCWDTRYSIIFQAVDGNDPEHFGGWPTVACEVYVLPGPHTFGIKFLGGGSSGAGGAIGGLMEGLAKDLKYGPLGAELKFDTEAGREYMVHFKETTKPWRGVVEVKYWVEDVNSGKIIVGEKPTEADPNKGS
jgi:hypothetical protein